MSEWYSDSDDKRIREALLGRRIIAAEERPVRGEWGRTTNGGVLTLDDGTQIEFIANVGCGGCSSGWYGIESVAAFDNAITRVDVNETRDEKAYEDTLTIHVYAEGASADVLTVTGDEGNGYYGRGYEFHIIAPKEPADA